MLRNVIVGLMASLLVGMAFIPDEALAYRGGGARAGAVGARGGAVAGRGVAYRGGAVAYRGAAYRGAYPYRGAAVGAAVGAAAVGAAAYGAYGYGSGCYRNAYGQWACPNY